MSALDQLGNWPVGRAAGAVLTPDRVPATFGDTSAVFPLASLTKPLAAIAALVAVEEGAIELATPLTDAVLAAELPGATIRHLLAHSSGIAPERRQRAANPGTRRIYSNAGFDVLGEMVAEATAIAFGDYLHEAVFEPLSMSTARLHGSPAKDARASIADLARLIGAIMRGGEGVLDPSTLTAATTVQFPGLRGVLPGFGMQQHNDWGLGFEIKGDKSPHWTAPANSPETFGHFGQSGTMFWIDPVAQLAVITLSDRPFDEWAARAWPALSTAVLDEFGS